jgi:16S rRNA (cytosine967-C5)-methyltransferase
MALELLIKTQRAKQFSNIALDKALESCELGDADRRLVSALFYGVTERMITLDHRIKQLSSRPIEEIDTDTLNTLRLGLYQLMYMDRIPPHAAINETVSLCPRRTSGFVNGILRTHTRVGEMELPNKDTSPMEYLSVAYSVGLPLCQKLMGIYGFDRTESILLAFSHTAATTIRVNTLRISRGDLDAHMDGAAYTELSPNGLRVKGAVRELYGFDDGYFFVQDEASQICSAAVDAKDGETVMDICACPGSKTFGMAMDMNNKGKIYAYDLHAKKLSLITSGAERLGIDIISVAEQDGRKLVDGLTAKADRVLCDVPCSGFGVLSKKPELRYKDPAESAALPDIQLAILENACQYVKLGGTLVYSTCTIFPEENENNVKRFLDKHKDFSLTPFEVGGLTVPDGMITLLPDTYPTDGFFIAKLTRS